MKIKANRERLHRALANAIRVANHKDKTIPITASVLLQVEDGELSISATDLKTAIRTKFEVEAEDQGVCLTAKKAHDIVASMAGDEIEISIGDNYWTAFKDSRSRYKLAGAPPSNYPVLHFDDDVVYQEIRTDTLKRMIKGTEFSVYIGEGREMVAGLYLEAKDGHVVAVSTDGHRMSICDEEAPELSIKGDMITKEAAAAIRTVLAAEVAEIGFKKSKAYLRCGDVALSVSLSAAQFPPYKQIIPKSHENCAVVAREAFSETISRLATISAGVEYIVHVEASLNGLLIRADDPDLGDAEELFPVNSYKGETVKIGFNSNYVREWLDKAATCEEVHVYFGPAGKKGIANEPLLLLDGGEWSTVAVIMPVRL
jgi:DNA polymerase-3 subunit beta